MSDATRLKDGEPADPLDRNDRAPGDEGPDSDEPVEGYRGYLVGLNLAVILTALSFFIVSTDLVWAPSIPIAIAVLAVAQMGVHLVFFLHISSGPDSENNTLALAFGVLIVILVVGGSLFIMSHLNHMMPPMDKIMNMQR